MPQKNLKKLSNELIMKVTWKTDGEMQRDRDEKQFMKHE